MKDILDCLKVIINPREAPLGSLPKAIKTLDNLLVKESSSLHPRLKHFLQNRSYEKAFLWINNGVPEKGTCGK